MPRYYFHAVDRTRERDLDGVDLPDDHAAQQTASAYAGERLKDAPGRLWKDGTARVEVTNGSGVLLWTVVTIVVDAPRPRPMPVMQS